MTTSEVIGMTISAIKAAKRRVTSEPNYSPAPMPGIPLAGTSIGQAFVERTPD
jgi:hypothetical protein